MKRFASIALALFAVGCSHRVDASGFGQISAPVLPHVVQTGSKPIHWAVFPVPGSATLVPYQITRGPDGNIWFTAEDVNLSTGLIGRIKPSGEISEYPLPGSFVAGDITAGPDGNLWFTPDITRSTSSARVGKMTTAGQLTLYSGGLTPRGITKGPGNSLWMTTTSSYIERIDTTGHEAVFPIPAGDAGFEITNGPDGNLWFTLSTSAKIDSMTPAGVVTEYPISSPVAYPTSITVGSDHNLWFLAGTPGSGPGVVGRITTSGSITQFALPSDNNGSFNRIISVPNSLWYTRNSLSGTDYVGRITTSGAITEHAFPANPFSAYLGGIALGSDLNIWFTQTAAPGGEIGVYIRLVLTVTPAQIPFGAPGQAQVVTVSEPPYSGPWTATSSNSLVASVSPGPTSNEFVVTANASGSALVTIADTRQNYFNVTVAVP